jgi:hypothetical protein
LDIEWDNGRLSARAWNTLARLDVDTFEKLGAVRVRQLLMHRGCGRETIREILAFYDARLSKITMYSIMKLETPSPSLAELVARVTRDL